MTTEICLDLKYNDLRQVSCIGLAGGSYFLILFLFISLLCHPYLLILLPAIHRGDLFTCMIFGV